MAEKRRKKGIILKRNDCLEAEGRVRQFHSTTKLYNISTCTAVKHIHVQTAYVCICTYTWNVMYHNISYLICSTYKPLLNEYIKEREVEGILMAKSTNLLFHDHVLNFLQVSNSHDLQPEHPLQEHEPITELRHDLVNVWPWRGVTTVSIDRWWRNR